MTLPTFSNYGNYSSDNYGAHTLRIDTANLTLWYSYKTIIAYQDAQDGLVVSENAWTTTTGKHLNWIDGGNKKSRKPHADFEAMLEASCKRHGV